MQEKIDNQVLEAIRLIIKEKKGKIHPEKAFIFEISNKTGIGQIQVQKSIDKLKILNKIKTGITIKDDYIELI